jgi:hypothetical protein
MSSSATSSSNDLPQLKSASHTEGDTDMMHLLSSQEDGMDQTAREEELLLDFDAATRLLGADWPSGSRAQFIPILQAGPGGAIYAPPDFVTASIDMNRLVFSRHLTPEERRAVLFSSDQIIP